MKQIFLDTETTGLWPGKHGLIQLSGKVFISNKKMVEFNYYIKPFPEDVIDASALKTNGLTIDESFSDPKVVYNAFTKMLKSYVNPYDKEDKFHIIAYNAPFDTDHLRAWFRKNGDRYYGSYFWHPPIDVMTLAAYWLMDTRSHMPDFKLSTVCKECGIKVEEESLHDALYDVWLAQELYNCITEDLLSLNRAAEDIME